MKTINDITAQAIRIYDLAAALYDGDRYSRTLYTVQAIAERYQRRIIDAVGPVNKPQPRAIYAA